MRTVYSDRHRAQDGQAELIDGQLQPCFEMPRRADIVLAAVRAAGLGDVVEPTAHGRAPVERVHTQAYLDFLISAWDEWVAEHGAYDALPLGWPTRGFRQDRVPAAIDGKLSYYSMDAGTPITAGTWDAATAAVDVALTAADRVLAGERAAFALCRPPGHHASADVYGGYCFLNNAAVATQWLRDRGADRVAVVDVDYHHGNGTQSVFFDRADVFVTSLHGDPAQEYPYFLGYADEVGAGPGYGCNRNYPLPWGTDWERYAEALDDALGHVGRFGPDVVVVSLGCDTFEHDPISHFRLRREHYAPLGARLASLGAPAVFVLEGGYAVDDLGLNAVDVLRGFETG